MLAGLDAEDASAAELLHGNWIRTHYIHRPCPASVLRWLFANACHHRRSNIASAAARTFSALLGGFETRPPWVPKPSDFVGALECHGAVAETLLVTPQQRSCPAGTVPAQADPAPYVDDPRQNLLAFLELLPICARWWSNLAVDDRIEATRLLLRLMLEPHAAPAFLHLQDAIAALLDGAKESDWSTLWLPGLAQSVQVRIRSPAPPPRCRACEGNTLPATAICY